MGAPIAQKRLADGMAGHVKKLAARLRLALGERVPVAALAAQQLVAQAPEQHLIRRARLGVRLEALALEPLCGERAFGALLHTLLGHRETKHRQTAIAVPVRAEAPGETLVGLWEAAIARRGRGNRGQRR